MSSLRVVRVLFVVSAIGALLGFTGVFAWDHPMALLFSSFGLLCTAVAMAALLIDRRRRRGE